MKEVGSECSDDPTFIDMLLDGLFGKDNILLNLSTPHQFCDMKKLLVLHFKRVKCLFRLFMQVSPLGVSSMDCAPTSLTQKQFCINKS